MRAARLGQAGSGRRLAPHPIGTHSCSAERRHDVIVTTPSHARTACRCGHRDAVFALLASSGVGRVFLAGGCAVLRSSSIAMSRSLGFLLVTSCRFAAKSFAITGCGASEQGAAEVVKSVPQWCPVVRALSVCAERAHLSLLDMGMYSRCDRRRGATGICAMETSEHLPAVCTRGRRVPPLGQVRLE